MASKMIEERFASRRPSKFAEEGPPGEMGDDEPEEMEEGEEAERGAPPDADDGADVEMKAVDDLSDILGVGPEDREDFAKALEAYVALTLAKTMAMGPGDAGPPEEAEGAPVDPEE